MLSRNRGKWRIKVITSEVVNEKLMLRHNRVITKYMAPWKQMVRINNYVWIQRREEDPTAMGRFSWSVEELLQGA